MSKQKIVRAGVGVIVCNGRLVLVGERKGSHGEGLYAFPGGHLDITDPSLAACGEREVYEETRIVAKVLSPDGYRQELFTTFDKLAEGKVYVTSYLVAEYIRGGNMNVVGDVVLPSEPDKCKMWYWVDLNRLASMVTTPEQKLWIPLELVSYYLQQYWDKK